jgi:cytochrome c biogenesis protein CcdA
MAGGRPVAAPLAMTAGIFVTNLAFGVTLALGLAAILDQLDAVLLRVWKSPHTHELLIQVLIGALLLYVAIRIGNPRMRSAGTDVPVRQSIVGAFLFGIGLTILGLPGALPYFAAIDQILRADASTGGMIAALAYYNAVFVAPLVMIVILRLLLAARSAPLLDAVGDFLGAWGRRLVATLLAALGAVMVIDGIGWFLGMPLIPV